MGEDGRSKGKEICSRVLDLSGGSGIPEVGGSQEGIEICDHSGYSGVEGIHQGGKTQTSSGIDSI